MSTKSLLNRTSRKKRDTMLSITKTNSGQAATQGPATPNGAPAGGINCYLWCATARYQGDPSTAPYVGDQSARSAVTCYMRGVKENLEFTPNTVAAWQWRRICFTEKAFSTGQALFYNDSTVGYGRLWYNTGGDNTTTSLTNLSNIAAYVFRGQVNKDWDNYMNATVDTTRISVKYDKTRTIASGNAAPTIRKFNIWHPMNKNLTYDDDENGTNETSQPFSTQSRVGMGDYYILDFFQASRGSVANDQLFVSSDATLYWHEK